MRMLSRHPGRALTIGIGAVALAALAANGPVAAGESGAQVESGDAVSQPVSDMAPMIEPMEDVDESDAVSQPVSDMAPMIEPMEDVDE